LFSALGAGCSAAGDPQSMAECNQLVKAYCERVGECHVQAGNVSSSERAAFVAECRNNGDRYQHCDTAIGISDGFDGCISAIQSEGCTSVVQDYSGKVHRPPSACSGVVTFTK
jgi:hypothetical protein